ncbi:GNAT family N-acetyltransferase [Paenisporosarcina cavernae]|uniref:GNAT family N-acetyltransferase n=1 Tax=Paenisporosarcina cavernae TaxID=2320858 RepID=A0A385YPX0_9BACL|nr:GNAT family N-acetyltransferase [Paenisporosarcina cavernae]AYC28554.1 GNAT family N-acetyltransferase [Paenisporosarcina cavernae]
MTQKQTVIIRPVSESDANDLFNIQQSDISEGDYFIVVPKDMEGVTAENHLKQIQSVLASENDLILVAESENKVIGSIRFRAQIYERLAHTGTISMSIAKEHRSKGIGKLLLSALLDWAEKHPSIEKVSLGVFSTNSQAIALYQKMGFQEEGRKIREIKLSETEYIADIIMCKFV